MRVIVLTTSERDGPAVRLLAALAAALGRQGHITAVACRSGGDVERAIEVEWPRLSHRAVVGAGFARQLVSVRRIVKALRPDAVLVGTDRDASLAAAALGARGGVVHRLPVEAGAPDARAAAARRWRHRLARSRTRCEAWGTATPAVSWPEPSDMAPPDPSIRSLPIAPPHLVIVPAPEHDAETALALRAAAMIRTRHPALRVTLLGRVAQLQGTRLHAAALDLTSAVQIEPLDRLLHHALPPALAVWVCAPGDTGAVSALAAMQRAMPVVLPASVPAATLVEAGVSGFTVTEPTLPMVVAELVRLLGDHEAAQRLGRAAQARAHTAFGWGAFVNEAADRLARVSRSATARARVRPVLTPG